MSPHHHIYYILQRSTRFYTQILKCADLLNGLLRACVEMKCHTCNKIYFSVQKKNKQKIYFADYNNPVYFTFHYIYFDFKLKICTIIKINKQNKMDDDKTNDIETLKLRQIYQKLKYQHMLHKVIMEAMRKIEYKNSSSTDIDKVKIGKMLKFVQIKDYIKSDNKDPQINALGMYNLILVTKT